MLSSVFSSHHCSEVDQARCEISQSLAGRYNALGIAAALERRWAFSHGTEGTGWGDVSFHGVSSVAICRSLRFCPIKCWPPSAGTRFTVLIYMQANGQLNRCELCRPLCREARLGRVAARVGQLSFRSCMQSVGPGRVVIEVVMDFPTQDSGCSFDTLEGSKEFLSFPHAGAHQPDHPHKFRPGAGRSLRCLVCLMLCSGIIFGEQTV